MALGALGAHAHVAAAHTLLVGDGVAVLTGHKQGWGVHGSRAMVLTSLSMLPSRGKLPTQQEPDTENACTQAGNETLRLSRLSSIIPTALITTARVGVITPSRVQDTAVLRVTLVTPTRRPSTLSHRADTLTPLCRVSWAVSVWPSSTSGGQGSTRREPCTESLCSLSTPFHCSTVPS